MKDIHEIVNSVSKSDRNAFNTFYDLYYDHVFHFSFYFLKDTEACKEVVSEVFLSVWQSRTKLKEIINLDTWLYVLTKNQCIRYSNKANKIPTIPLDEAIKVSVQLQEKGEGKNPEEVMQEKEIEQLLADIINTLPEKCRIIFLMSRHDGLKTKEIAEALSLQESTVRVQMKIAIKKIIEGIKPYYPNLSLCILLKIILNSISN